MPNIFLILGIIFGLMIVIPNILILVTVGYVFACKHYRNWKYKLQTFYQTEA